MSTDGKFIALAAAATALSMIVGATGAKSDYGSEDYWLGFEDGKQEAYDNLGDQPVFVYIRNASLSCLIDSADDFVIEVSC